MKKFLLSLLPCACLAQTPGPARIVFVSSPKPRVISAERIQLSALARDQNGLARSGDAFTWRSGNIGMATVDSSGGVTAGRTLGLVDIFATTTIGNIAGSVRLQILPLRIDVFPSSGELFVGDALQYSARAVDLNGEPIPNVFFAWQVTAATGGGSQAVAMSGTGMLSARGTGRFAIRAMINYGGVVGQFINPFVGVSYIDIKPRNNFRLTRLLSSAEVRNSFQLRPILNRPMAVNDAGQAALVGSLDGLTNALLLYEGGRFDVLASGGQPGPTAGGLIFDFGSPAINNRGQVLTRVAVQGTSGLALASRGLGLTYLAVDGMSAGGVEQVGGYSVNPFSLNDNGEVVFEAGFQLGGQGRRGIFRMLAGGAPQRIATTGEALPGLPGGPASFPSWGIDRDGVAYFQAFRNPDQAIFRQQGFTPPTRVIGSGDALAGSTIRNIGAMAISASGDLALFYTLANNSNGLARITGGQTQFIPLRNYRGIISVHGAAGVLFDGEGDRGWGLHRWNTGAPVAVLLDGRLAPNNEPVRQVYSATLTGRGEVFALVRTTLTSLVAIQPGGSRPVLFQSGARVDSPANIHLTNGSLVRGSGAGPPFLLLGSPNSLFQLDSRGLVPRLVLGDRIPDGAFYQGLGSPIETGSGDLYIDFGGYWNRKITGDRIEDFPLGSFRAEDGVNVGRGLIRAMNDRGVYVWDAGTDRNQTRLYYSEAGRNTLLATYSGEARFQSPAPSGGTVNGRGEVAIDEQNRVMVNFRVTGGPSGWFLWDRGRWTQTAVYPIPATGPTPTTSIKGQVISTSNNLRAMGDSFYAVFNLRVGGSALAEFRDNTWRWIAGNQDIGPNGSPFNNIGAYDVNRRGDIAYAINGGQLLVVRSGGQDRLVHLNTETPDAGNFFSAQAVELREDGRVYFGGMNPLDQYELWLAEPLLTSPPVRSRRGEN